MTEKKTKRPASKKTATTRKAKKPATSGARKKTVGTKAKKAPATRARANKPPVLDLKNPKTTGPTPTPDSQSVFEDPENFSRYMADISERGREVMEEYFKHHAARGRAKAASSTDPLTVGSTMSEVMADVFTNPFSLMRAQVNIWEDYTKLFEATVSKMAGDDTVEPVAAPLTGDRRFSHEAWEKNPTLDYLKQSYLIMCKWARAMVADADDLDPHTKKKAEFYTEQFLAALAPTNFASTNPDVIDETLRSRGENFMRGFQNFMEDLERGHGELAMRQVDLDFFKVGENIATTPGKVVYQNELLQLIQYEPTTKKVAERPLVIFPPWINKFYILDLQPANSLISWLVDQGRTVFVVSWVNPGHELKDVSFADYLRTGIFDTLSAVEKATGVHGADTIGYCIGGTLLACALAHMAKTGDDRIKSATFFTAQMDFAEAGDLLVFVDEEQLRNIEAEIDAAGGIMEASMMSRTFNMLRPTDLIWSVFVDNYLIGKDPKRFDLLYWNADATRMSKEVYLYYLRTFYQQNKLSRGELILDNVHLDMGDVDIPIFMQAGEKDHIAPPNSIYRSARLFGGEDVTYMLAGSGHIAGVVNHPDKKKYHYSTNSDLPETLDQWKESATRHEYSWWPHWIKWLNKRSPGKVPARVPGDGGLDVIEDAPGSYVLERSD